MFENTSFILFYILFCQSSPPHVVSRLAHLSYEPWSLRNIMSGGGAGSIHSGGRKGVGGKPIQKSADDVNKDIRFL